MHLEMLSTIWRPFCPVGRWVESERYSRSLFLVLVLLAFTYIEEPVEAAVAARQDS